MKGSYFQRGAGCGQDAVYLFCDAEWWCARACVCVCVLKWLSVLVQGAVSGEGAF